jgi:hypothetical protein
MRSIKATLVGAAALALPIPLVSWAYAHLEALPEGAPLSLPFRIVVATGNWYTRFLPFIALVVFSATALVAAFISRSEGFQSKRRALLFWICVSVTDWVLLLTVWWLPFSAFTNTTVSQFLVVSMTLGLIAPLSAMVLAAQIQGTIWEAGASRVRGWHIAASGAALLLLAGPTALLPPAWVWLASRRIGNTATSG